MSLKQGLCAFHVTAKETNLHIQAETDLTQQALRSVLKWRGYIESHIQRFPEFAASFVPIRTERYAPAIIREMKKASELAGVGPMASVAGAVAEFTGNDLLRKTGEVVVENGGDIFIKSDTPTIFTIYAKNSPFSMKTGLLVEKRDHPYALCTSSGTFGHSKSFGTADAVSILSASAPLADAVATALGNQVQKKKDIEKIIEKAKNIKGVEGIVAIKDDRIGLWGKLQIVRL